MIFANFTRNFLVITFLPLIANLILLNAPEFTLMQQAEQGDGEESALALESGFVFSLFFI